MISLFVSDDVVAVLINEQFEDMLREWEWEQENKEYLEDVAYLRKLAKSMRSYYESGNMERFLSTWDFYSDIYKDVHGYRPHGFLESQPWFHGC